jgi:hypothetical protein
VQSLTTQNNMETQTQELVQIGQTPTEVGFVAPIDTGLDSVGSLKITNLILVQNTTRDTMGARPGQILDQLTGEAFDDLAVVPLRISKTRVMFPPDSDLDADPICRSSDGLVPSPYAKVPQARQCVGQDARGRIVPLCANAKWRKDASGRSIKPPCAEKYRLLLYVVSTGLPRWFNVGGKGIAALDISIQRLKQDRIRAKTQNGLSLELYDYWFKLGADRISDKKGSYYVPRFDVKRVQTPGEYAPVFMDFAAAIGAQNADDEVAAQETAVDVAVTTAIEGEFVSEV